MHMAWAVGTPVVALFGPTTEGDVEPLGEKNITLIAKDVDCLRCHKEYCETKKCMYAITPQMVLNAITGLGIRIQSWKCWKSRKSWKGQKYYAALWDCFACGTATVVACGNCQRTVDAKPFILRKSPSYTSLRAVKDCVAIHPLY